ncbi:MAG: phage integrase N-terminal SAM-like domain-containing protein [Deltaproteobacteria bacterium]|nr:phage integrase N-terminal SAM-like domain-containing protein [Deltaproteobacteria bacterium]
MRQFQTYTRSKPPALLSTADVKEFLTSLAVKRQVSASTQNQAFNALLFFFRHVPHKEFCLKTYFFFEMMTYLLVTPIIFFFCMADTTFALKRSEESGA